MDICKIFCAIAIIITIIACSSKNSPIGYTGSNFHNDTLSIRVFDEIYSYEETPANYPRSTKLIVGQFQGIEARTLVGFGAPPDTTGLISTTVTLYIREDTKERFTGSKIKMAYLKGEHRFADNIATWYRCNGNNDWNTPGGDKGDPIEIAYTPDADSIPSISFQIPNEIVKEWKESEGATNFGMIFYTDTDTNPDINSFVEFHSTESTLTARRPRISFTFLREMKDENDENEEMEPVTEHGLAISDTFIYSYPLPDALDRNTADILLANIYPKSIFIKFPMPDSIRVNEEGEYSKDVKKVNIINAEIVFTVADTTTMYSSKIITSIAQHPNDDKKYTIDLAAALSREISTTTISPTKEDKVTINITRPLQLIITEANDLKDAGICLINRSINHDFSFLKFEPNPEIHIKYSIPKSKQ